MATNNKDFKVKHGLIVEGASATVNNNQVLTENASDQYIINLIGGETLITSVSNEFDVSLAGELSIDRATVDAYYDAAGDAAAAQLAAEQYADGLAVNYDPAGSASTAESNANSYTNTALNDYTPTASLDTTIDGYGYLKSADLSGYATESYVNGEIDALNTDAIEEAPGATNQYFTESRARNSVSGVNGVNYDSNLGEISAHLGNGLELDGTGAIQIDGLVVATQSDLTDAISAHNNLSDVHGVTGEVLGTTDTQTISNKTLGSDLAAGGFKITGLATPENSGDAATKAYVDAVSEGLHVHEAARVAINGNISIANGLENGDTAGGVTLATGDRVLVKDQTNPAENGIYVVQVSGQALRATDFDTATEIDSGDFIFVTAGTYANTGWVQTLKPATIGTDALSFTQFSGAGTFTAGNGLNLDGTVFEIDETITATVTYVGTEIADHANDTATHGVTGAIVGTSDSQTLTNKALGASTTLSANLDASSNKITNLEDPTSAQDAATKFYVDAAEADANSYTDSGLALKQDSLTVGDGLDLNGATLNVNSGEMVNKVVNGVSGNSYGIVGNATYLDITNPTGYNSEIDVDIAALESKLTTDGFASQTDISNAINDLDTDDIEEGVTNLYYTNTRAKAEAASLLVNATKTNIVITKDGSNNLTITAENGVADSTTTDLTEGTNLYFTDARARTAVDGTTRSFTAVEVNSVAKQVASTLTAATAGIQVGHAWAKADYRSAEFLVKVAYGDHTEISKVLLTLDVNDNIAITEYGIVGTNGSGMTVSAGISGANAQLLVTTANNNSIVTVVGTLLA